MVTDNGWCRVANHTVGPPTIETDVFRRDDDVCLLSWNFFAPRFKIPIGLYCTVLVLTYFSFK